MVLIQKVANVLRMFQQMTIIAKLHCMKIYAKFVEKEPIYLNFINKCLIDVLIINRIFSAI